MNPNIQGTPHYNIAGTNTLTQVSTSAVTIYSLHIEQNGGSAGFLQLYDGGSAGAAGSAGTPQVAFAVSSGTSGAGTPSIGRDTFPAGLHFGNGLSYLWAAGATGTVAHGVNAAVVLTNTRT